MSHDAHPQPGMTSESERLIGRTLRHVKSTGSTMDDVTCLARDGEAEGLVLWADRQESGRGRFGRAWESEVAEDILASILFRPRPAIAVEVNIILALAIAETVDEICGTDAAIKWPNDVRVDGAKIAGILLESSQDADGLSVVAGFGLNVNSQMRGRSPGGIEAVSMRDLAERDFDRAAVLETLLAKIDSLYAQVRAGGTAVPAWRTKIETIGQEIEVTFASANDTGRTISGVAEDVDETGRLLVRDSSGRVWPVSAGEVSLRRNAGRS